MYTQKKYKTIETGKRLSVNENVKQKDSAEEGVRARDLQSMRPISRDFFFTI